MIETYREKRNCKINWKRNGIWCFIFL